MNRMRAGLAAGLRGVTKAFASDYLWYGIIALVVLQAGWYALSFKPWINDEPHHIAVISIYAQHIGPFLGKQQPSWDHLGAISNGGSFIFYWVMSWPYRLLNSITSSYELLVIGLRFVSLAAFVGGLILYRRAMLAIGQIPKSAIQGCLLLFILVPAVALLPGTVNYDTFVFLLFGWILLLTVQVIQSRRLPLARLALLTIAGLLITVFNWTALALLLPIAICLLVALMKYRHKGILKQTQSAYRAIEPWRQLALAAGLLLALTLFVERPVMNVIHFGTPQASCRVVLGVARCHHNPNYVAYQNLAENKPSGFSPDDPVRYFYADWLPVMADKAGNVFERGGATEIAAFKQLSYGVSVIWLVLIAVTWRDMWRSNVYRYLLIIVVLYSASLFLNEYAGYLRYGLPVAIRPRYLIPVLPLMAYLGVAATLVIWPKRRNWLAATGVCFLILMTQGGGITTYLLTTPSNAYWPNSEQPNNAVRQIIKPLAR